MDTKILSVYINLQDERVDLPSYLDNSKFIISICPYSIVGGKFSNEGIKEIKELLERGCLLGQRGYIGRCPYPHTHGTDPWHENFCLYNPQISRESQLELMTKGRNILKETFGVNPVIYAPINHLFDDDTLAVVQILKYSYMMDQNNFGIYPYEQHGVIIIPESKIGDKETPKSFGIYAHVDMFKNIKTSSFIKKFNLLLPSQIKPRKAEQNILTLNEIQKRIKKYERDKKSLS